MATKLNNDTLSTDSVKALSTVISWFANTGFKTQNDVDIAQQTAAIHL